MMDPQDRPTSQPAVAAAHVFKSQACQVQFQQMHWRIWSLAQYFQVIVGGRWTLEQKDLLWILAFSLSSWAAETGFMDLWACFLYFKNRNKSIYLKSLVSGLNEILQVKTWAHRKCSINILLIIHSHSSFLPNTPTSYTRFIWKRFPGSVWKSLEMVNPPLCKEV